jgi:hypothetical protein
MCKAGRSFTPSLRITLTSYSHAPEFGATLLQYRDVARDTSAAADSGTKCEKADYNS